MTATLNLKLPKAGDQVMITRDGGTFKANVSRLEIDGDKLRLSFIPEDQHTNGLYGFVYLSALPADCGLRLYKGE